ncbi:tol-pal system-associated acyl-CoA thioesterase [Aurantivibrio infirmus]
MIREFSLPLKVYIEDTDAGGIVYHVNYLKFMERSRTEFITQLGYDKPATIEGGMLLVVHSMAINFLQPAKLGELLLATTETTKLARSYVVFDQAVKREDHVLCSAEVKVACVSQANMKPTAMPAALRDALLQSLEH